MACAVALIGGRTSDKKEELKMLGFRWHSARRNWFRYGDPEEIDSLHKLSMMIWEKYPGQILFKTFVAPDKVENPEIPF